ncbi:TIM-barrel domain-containing protein [Pantanalinema sp. GBBB05]|uniref:glycoside hydrolase family 31 protein n=1 Tax=Pantanalinema sp. GBBB05 TaxID=2604139 RepID=UPI001D25D3AA|nr:glycoside hydrolase family 31 protein [Pantanalinema sp. GBBB05]
MTLDQSQALDFSELIQSRFKKLSLKFKFFLGSLFYLTYAVYAYRYSRQRDRLEQQFTVPPTLEVVESPGKLLQAESWARGAYFYFEQAELEICFLKPDFVQLNWKPGLPPVPYALAKPIDHMSWQLWSEVTIDLNPTAEGWTVSSGELQIAVSATGQVKFYTARGELLREELPPRRESEAWSHQTRLRPEENLYGLGERAARLNLRAHDLFQPPTPDVETKAELPSTTRTYRMWNYDAAGMYAPGSDPMYISIPVYISLHSQGSYLIFYENSFEATFTFDDAHATAAFTGGALRYYVATGSPTQLVERYTELTGRSPLPPRWALGYHQSRWGYRTEAAVRETVQQFRELDLPLSAIHLDIDVQVGYRAFTIDPQRFPELGKFTKELASEGVQFITIINPGIKYSRKSKLFLEGRMLEAFCKLPTGDLAIAPVWCGWSAFPDFTNPLVRQWWSRQYEFMLDLGVAGFWHDMNEPAAFITWGDRSLPKVVRHHLEGRGGDHQEAHNVYGFLQARAGYESLCQYRPNQRPFIVSRAGWAGLQRYAWTWTGDIECTWECMQQTIPTVLGLGLSGIAYSGPDIGGFQGNPSAELYLRWFQMATFMPFYRSHCSNNVEYRTPWTYGEPYLSIMRNFLQLRYQLMPYFYTLAWEASQKGYPLIRPLFWYNPDQPALWSIDDAFYLGNALIIYPVFEEGGRSRLVTVPPGSWYSFWDDSVVEGMAQVKLAAPLEQMPLLVKAGSILPMVIDDDLVLHLYPPVQGSSEDCIYSDAGDGYGEWRLDHFRLVRFAEGLELFWEQQGDFPCLYPFPYRRIQLQVHGFQLQNLWVDGQDMTASKGQSQSDRRTQTIIPSPFRQAYLQGVFMND